MWTTSPNYIQVLSGDAVLALRDVVPPSGLVAVANLRGMEMASADDIFESFSDAFNFPSYFGWNWPALSECVRDLRWIPADHYVVVVEDAPRVLPESVEGRREFFRILARAGRHWASPYNSQSSGKPSSFHTFLLCADRDVESFEKEIAEFLK